jgi:hypothetical protein
LNALVYHGTPYRADIEPLKELTKCNKMPCMNLAKMWKRLGIKPMRFFWNKEWILGNLPVECAVVHKDYGYHSILIVGGDEAEVEVVGFFKKEFTWRELENYLPEKSIRIVRNLKLI